MDAKGYDKTLLEPIQVGDLKLNNKIVMAAMTRIRCDPKSGVANDLLVKYYSQRASAGFILTECSAISKAGNGIPGCAAIYTQEQADGWKKVIDAVHAKGGKIVLQIWHGGRSANPEVTGEPSLAPSALPIRGFDAEGKETVGPTPKEMTKEDIQLVLSQFRKSAELAKAAGFDALQLHGANGYLVDEFLRDATNKRTDEYGGSIENRCRFCLEAIDTLIDVYGAGRVGIKLSPVGRFQDMYDSNPIETYTYLLKKLSERKIAFVEMTQANEYEGKSNYPSSTEQIPDVARQFKPAFSGSFIANSGLTLSTAATFIQEGKADLVSFGKFYISNPDLVERIQNGWELNNNLDFKTFYFGGEAGYIDYPEYSAASKTEVKSAEQPAVEQTVA